MSDLVGNPEDRYCHNEAHLYVDFMKPRFTMDITRAVRNESVLGNHVADQVPHVRHYTGLSETRDLDRNVPRDFPNVHCVDSRGILSHCGSSSSREIRVNKQRPYLLLYLVTHLHIRNVCTLLTSHDGGHILWTTNHCAGWC